MTVYDHTAIDFALFSTQNSDCTTSLRKQVCFMVAKPGLYGRETGLPKKWKRHKWDFWDP